MRGIAVPSDFAEFDNYRKVVQAQNPSLYWPMNARWGRVDLAGGGFHGSFGNNVSDLGGRLGSPIYSEATSTDFDGRTISLSTASYSPFANGAVRTFCGWAYRDNSATTDALLGGGLTDPPFLRITGATQNVVFDPNNSVAGGAVTWTNAWPGARVWTHFALIFDEAGDTAALWINAVLVSSQAAAQAYGAGATGFALGRWGIGDYWNGAMAHFAIFERALTQTELSAQYAYYGSTPPDRPGHTHTAGRSQ